MKVSIADAPFTDLTGGVLTRPRPAVVIAVPILNAHRRLSGVNRKDALGRWLRPSGVILPVL